MKLHIKGHDVANERNTAKHKKERLMQVKKSHFWGWFLPVHHCEKKMKKRTGVGKQTRK